MSSPQTPIPTKAGLLAISVKHVLFFSLLTGCMEEPGCASGGGWNKGAGGEIPHLYPDTSALVEGLCWGKPITHRSGTSPPPPDSAPCWPSLHFAHPFCKPQCNAIFQFCAEEAEKLFSLGPGVESHTALGLGLYHQYSLQDLSVWFLSAAGTGLPLPGGRDPLDLDAVAHLGLLSSPSQISSCFSWSSSFGGQAQGARLPELVACWVMRGNKKLKEILSHTVPDWGATCKLW